jgi:hypothetical protein
VSIAAEVSRLVSSSVERRRLNGANLLHQIIDRRKFLAFERFIINPRAPWQTPYSSSRSI